MITKEILKLRLLEEKEVVVGRLVNGTDFDSGKIAFFANVTVEFVEAIKDGFEWNHTIERLKIVTREEVAASFVQNLINGTDFDSEKIASIVNVTVEFVDEVKERLQQSK
jgi:hypothetical protein